MKLNWINTLPDGETTRKEFAFLPDKEGVENHVVNLYPEITFQTMEGFGGAITDAAGYVYSLMKEEQKHQLMETYFSPEQMKYGIVRIHMDSCDFSTEMYEAMSDPSDRELKTFSFSRTEKYILPMLADAENAAGKKLKLMLSPWSPPAFMKTNGERKHGGSLKPEYREFWADYICRYILEFRKRGYEVQRISLQNEPKAVQPWDSCIYTAREEKEFLRDFMYPALQKHELYAPFTIDVIQTKRHISCNGRTRKGEDVIVTIPPKQRTSIKLVPKPLPEQVSAYPPTRFMGSKSKLLSEIWSVASQFNVNTVVDLFSGSGIVGYMFKAQGKAVISNDYMAMSATFTKAMVENNTVTLPLEEAERLLVSHKESDHFVATKFQGLYYTDEENDLIDTLRTNIAAIRDPYKHAIAMTALIRACTKKRPRGIFTYTGHRYDDGRKDLQKSLAEQFLDAVEAVNSAVFDNGKVNRSKHGDAMDLRVEQADLVYIDPPYYSPLSDNEYVRRYHFVEGLARDWKGVEIQEHTQTKKFKSYPTPFSTRKGAADAFDKLFKKFANSILIVSYSSNSLPTQDEMVAIMAKYKQHVEVIPIDYKYSFGNQNEAKTHRNSVQEYLFVGY